MASDLTYHGVEYQSVAQNIGQPPTIERLRELGLRHVRIQWVDLHNNIRYRVVRLPYFEKLLKTSRPGTSLTKACLGIVFINIADGFKCAFFSPDRQGKAYISASATGEYLYAVDLSSLKICPYAPGHASVMGWFEEKNPIPNLTNHRAVEVDLCPRTILRRVVE